MTPNKVYNLMHEAASVVKMIEGIIPNSAGIRIGGSLALAWQLPTYSINRDIHDIDIIVYAYDNSIDRIRQQVENLSMLSKVSLNKASSLLIDKQASPHIGDSFMLKLKVMGKYINLIVAKYKSNSIGNYIPERFEGVQVQHPSLIKEAKLGYKPVRQKDLRDITLIESWEHVELCFDLPF